MDDSTEPIKATLVQYIPDAGAPESDFTFTINELEVSFDSSNATDDMGIVSYLWDFGDGNTSSEANPVHLYRESGTYDVTLTVTDADGKADTSLQTLQVQGNGVPVALAEADVIEGPAPLSVSFMGSNSTDDVAVVGYLWNFGNGMTSTDADPTTIFEDEVPTR